MGDGTGKKDVSDQIEDEVFFGSKNTLTGFWMVNFSVILKEQLVGTKNEEKEENKEEQSQSKEDEGFEMQQGKYIILCFRLNWTFFCSVEIC